MLENNTIFRGLGNVAAIMIDCLDAYPEQFADYKADKQAAKEAIRPHMRRLLQELRDPDTLKAFFGSSSTRRCSMAATRNTPQSMWAQPKIRPEQSIFIHSIRMK